MTVVTVVEGALSRTNRKGRVFYINKMADKRFLTCSLSLAPHSHQQLFHITAFQPGQLRNCLIIILLAFT